VIPQCDFFIRVEAKVLARFNNVNVFKREIGEREKMARTRTVAMQLSKSDYPVAGSKVAEEAERSRGTVVAALRAIMDKRFIENGHGESFHVDSSGLLDVLRKIDPEAGRFVRLGKGDAISGVWRVDRRRHILVKIAEIDELSYDLKGLEWHEVLTISPRAAAVIRRPYKGSEDKKRLLDLDCENSNEGLSLDRCDPYYKALVAIQPLKQIIKKRE
jgi:hypothetical protein